MAYITQTDLENALSAQTVSQLYDDSNLGTLNSAALTAVLKRASALVDGWIAPVYSGPFPITQNPIPALIQELATIYAVAFSFERHPDYVRTFGDNKRADIWQRADEMGMRLQAAVLRLPDLVAQPKPANVGGVVVDNSHRLYIDSADGTLNAGDF